MTTRRKKHASTDASRDRGTFASADQADTPWRTRNTRGLPGRFTSRERTSMAERRPPRKSRVWVAPRIGGYQAKPSADPKPEPPPKSATPPEAYSAPGHMGGQFEEAGYHSGAGIFGFTQR